MGVFGQLTLSYMVFAVLLVLTMLACAMAMLVGVTRGNVEGFSPAAMRGADGQIENFATIERLGGWVEMLDADYRVLDVAGAKKDDAKQYTAVELLLMQRDGASDDMGAYTAFLTSTATGYDLVKIPRSALRTIYSIEAANAGAVGGWGHWAVFAIGLVFALDCALMGLYLSRRIKHPLGAILRGMDRVRAGEQDVRLDFSAQPEFERIRDTFNQMNAQIEAGQASRLQAEQRKRQLLLDLSHDIKTPLSTIVGYADALQSGLVPEHRRQSYLETLEAKAARVSQLVDQLFTMLTLDSEQFPLHRNPTDINDLARQACIEHHEDIAQRGLELIIDIPEDALTLPLDPQLMRRALTNLLSNAARYNRSGKHIWLSVTPDHHGATIQVSDDGAPIAPDLIPNLFEPFTRANDARPSSEGAGLGLSITRAIVERHGSSIRYYRIYLRMKNGFPSSGNINIAIRRHSCDGCIQTVTAI